MGLIKKIKEFKWGYVLIALALIALGLCFLVWSEEALKTLAIVIGVILMLASVTTTVTALASKGRGAGFAFKIFFAVMLLVAGIITAIVNDGAIDIIVSVFALVLIIDSSFKLHTSAMSKRYKLVGWWFIMVIASLSIVASFLLLKLGLGIRAASLLLGTVMLVNAINNILIAFYAGIFENRMENEIYYERKAEEDELFAEESEDSSLDEEEPADEATDEDVPEDEESDSVISEELDDEEREA